MKFVNRVKLEIDDDGVAWVTLIRPEKHNALDYPMFTAIKKCQNEISKTRHVRAVVIKGEGEDLCTGLDTKSVMKSPIDAIKLLFKWLPGNANLAQQVCIGWRKLPIPVIAFIHGRCWGGGLQIALGADFRLVTPTATLSIMESHWGLIPDMGGNKLLSELMPIDQAKYLAMTATQIDAEEARQLGLVTKVIQDEGGELTQFLGTLINRSPDVLAGVKSIYNRHWHRTLRNMLGAETIKQIKILLSPNQKIATQKAQGRSATFANRKVK